MKILQVTPFFSPVHGGSAIAPYYLSRELSKRGHEITVFTSDYKLSQEWIESLPQVYAFKTWSSWTKFYVTPGMRNHAKEEIKHFDLIHMHNYRTFQNIVIHYYAKKYGVPYVLQARGSLPRIEAKQRLKWIYDVFFGYGLLGDASKVIALSRMEAKQYRSMGMPEERIAIIPNGIDLSEYNDMPPKGSFKKKFNIPEEKKIILYIGRIHEIKGIDILIKAYAYAVKELGLNDALLTIAGSDDGYLGNLEQLLGSLRMSNDVLLTGPLYGKDKLEAYVDANVFVLPSRYETFPNVVLEAYACSKPVIASNVESIPDIVLHGKTGLLFRAANAQELAGMIAFMLTRVEDAERMGHKARKLAEENFSIDKVVSSLEALYEQVYKKHRIFSEISLTS